jgi:hypothetical protein
LRLEIDFRAAVRGPVERCAFLRLAAICFSVAIAFFVAENTGRVCRGIELDPLYVDVIIRRYEADTGAAVILADSGETLRKGAARRRNDEGDGRPSG